MTIESDDDSAVLIIDADFQDKNNENDGSRKVKKGDERSRPKGVLHQSQFESQTDPSNPLISNNKSLCTNESSEQSVKKPKVASEAKVKDSNSTIGRKRSHKSSPKKRLEKRRKGETIEQSGSDDPPPGSSWNIEDKSLPEPLRFDKVQEWIDGDTKKVFQEFNIHFNDTTGGWVMRDASSGILDVSKRICMGVLVCSRPCDFTDSSVGYQPAVNESALKKQIGRRCPNPICNGNLVHIPCKGYNGNPVIQLSRIYNKRWYFQNKGRHNHARPKFKIPSAESRVTPSGAPTSMLSKTSLVAIPQVSPQLQVSFPVDLVSVFLSNSQPPVYSELSVPSQFPLVNVYQSGNIPNSAPIDLSYQSTDPTWISRVTNMRNVVYGQKNGDHHPLTSNNSQCKPEDASIDIPINLSNKPTDTSRVAVIKEEEPAKARCDDRIREVINLPAESFNNKSDLHLRTLSNNSAPQPQSDKDHSAPPEQPKPSYTIEALLSNPYKSKSSD